MGGLAAFVMRGKPQAVLVTAAAGVAGLVIHPLSYLSGAALALVTLRLGPWTGAQVMLLAALAVGLVGLVSAGSWIPSLGLVLGLWLPLWASAQALRATVSLALAIQVIAGFAAAAVLWLHVVEADPAAWLQAQAEAFFRLALAGGASEADLQQVVGLLSGFLNPGFLAAAWLAGIVLSLFLARGWQARLYNPGGFRAELHGLRFGMPAGIAAVLAMGSALAFGGKAGLIADDLGRVALGAYLFAGMGLMHWFAARRGMHWGWLAGFYAVAILLLPQLLLALAFAGIVDTWLAVRRFRKNGGPADSGGGG